MRIPHAMGDLSRFVRIDRGAAGQMSRRRRPMPARHDQLVRYVRTADGARIAWAEIGEGPPVVKAANWLTHLEYERQSPVWAHWISFFSDHFRFIRYDERGCGLSAGADAELSLERRVEDLEAVIEAAGVAEPLTLLGISQGAATCVGYAVRHPERVARLILYGGYARGFTHSANEAVRTEWNAIIDLARVSWARDNPAFRSVFTGQFIPEGTPEQLEWLNELCRRSSTGPVAAQVLRACGDIDVVDLLPRVQAPTLVMHASRDAVVPVQSGRRLASEIPGAEFVQLESRNHVLLRDEPAWARFREAVLRFTERGAEADGEPFQSLTPRQREILSLLAEGLSNAAIAERLEISEKTVRNQVSTLFDKLGVWTRAQAIVFARDRNFAGGSRGTSR